MDKDQAVYSPVLRTESRIVLQGMGKFALGWHDLENVADCEYFQQKMPQRLAEYRVAFAASYADFRLVSRTITDAPHEPKTI